MLRILAPALGILAMAAFAMTTVTAPVYGATVQVTDNCGCEGGADKEKGKEKTESCGGEEGTKEKGKKGDGTV